MSFSRIFLFLFSGGIFIFQLFLLLNLFVYGDYSLLSFQVSFLRATCSCLEDTISSLISLNILTVCFFLLSVLITLDHFCVYEFYPSLSC